MVGKLNKILCHICKRARLTMHFFVYALFSICSFIRLFVHRLVHLCFFPKCHIFSSIDWDFRATPCMQDREIDDSAAATAATATQLGNDVIHESVLGESNEKKNSNIFFSTFSIL